MHRPATAWFASADRLASLAGQTTVAAHVAGGDELVPNPYPAIWCADWTWKVPGGFRDLDAYRVRLAGMYPHLQVIRSTEIRGAMKVVLHIVVADRGKPEGAGNAMLRASVVDRAVAPA